MNRRSSCVVLPITLALLLVACSRGSGTVPATSIATAPTTAATAATTTIPPVSIQTPPVAAPTAILMPVLRGTQPASTDCRTDVIATLLTGFLEAFNHGDQARLMRFFPPPEQRLFQYYRVVDQDGTAFVARDQTELSAHFMERRQGDRLQLRTLNVGATASPSIATVAIRLTRQAAGVARP